MQRRSWFKPSTARTFISSCYVFSKAEAQTGLRESAQTEAHCNAFAQIRQLNRLIHHDFNFEQNSVRSVYSLTLC